VGDTATRPRWRLRLVPVVALLCVGGCRPRAPVVEPAQQPHAVAANGVVAEGTDDERRVLAAFAAGPLYTYEVSIQTRRPEQAQQDAERFGSDGGSDPYSIRLLRAGRTIDRVVLFQSSCGQSSLHEVERVQGGDREAKSWTTDAEHCDIGIAARTVTLSADHTALLLTQAMGYEYRYSDHHLYLGQADGLRTLWSYEEDRTAADRSTASVLSTDVPGRQDVGFVHVRRTPDGVAAEVSAERLRFDPSTAAIVASPLPDRETPLYVLVVGAFDDATSAQASASTCHRELDLLQGSFFPELHTPRFYFGGVFVRRNDAEAALKAVKACPAVLKATILVQRST
jgi:hypothetical protein